MTSRFCFPVRPQKAHENGIEALKSVIEVCKESLENRYRDCARRTDSFAEKLRQTSELNEKHFVENEKAVASIQASLVAGCVCDVYTDGWCGSVFVLSNCLRICLVVLIMMSVILVAEDGHDTLGL